MQLPHWRQRRLDGLDARCRVVDEMQANDLTLTRR
jgi:hypothetical protein